MERLMIRRSEWAAPRHLQGRGYALGGASSAKLFQETVILQEQAYLLDTRGAIDPAKVSEAKPAVECRGVAVFSAFPFSFSR
uniref:Protein-tyrosine-phosphatase n=1 Tax=Ascaris lumbricoides TaxID=6252 RepID=A0A0M3IF61_ASCLU